MLRGAEQRSIVLVSEMPYSAVLAPLTCVVGPALLRSFHEIAPGIHEDACTCWPHPAPGSLCNISVGPHRVLGRVPLDACIAASEVSLWPEILSVPLPPASLPLCGVFGEVCLARTLHSLHRHLWTLWEIMLLGVPLMVFCSSPERAAIAVQALLALVSPLPYSPDYRPVLSIHDPQVPDVQVRGCHHRMLCACMLTALVIHAS
jgi:hypothetical protein